MANLEFLVDRLILDDTPRMTRNKTIILLVWAWGVVILSGIAQFYGCRVRTKRRL